MSLAVSGEEFEAATMVRGRRLMPAPGSPIPVLVGIALLVAGFVLMTIGWGAVAGLASVPLQLPYLFSCGLPGIGLVIIGVATITMSVKRREGAERARQINQLSDLLERIQRALETGNVE